MRYSEDTPFYRLLATKYDAAREQAAIEILDKHPEIGKFEWPGPDHKGKPFVQGIHPCEAASLIRARRGLILLDRF